MTLILQSHLAYLCDLFRALRGTPQALGPKLRIASLAWVCTKSTGCIGHRPSLFRFIVLRQRVHLLHFRLVGDALLHLHQRLHGGIAPHAIAAPTRIRCSTFSAGICPMTLILQSHLAYLCDLFRALRGTPQALGPKLRIASLAWVCTKSTGCIGHRPSLFRFIVLRQRVHLLHFRLVGDALLHLHQRLHGGIAPHSIATGTCCWCCTLCAWFRAVPRVFTRHLADLSDLFPAEGRGTQPLGRGSKGRITSLTWESAKSACCIGHGPILLNRSILLKRKACQTTMQVNICLTALTTKLAK